MESDYAIGLDLGTTFSCIGVYRNGGVEIIPNSIGEKITPSVVVFEDKEILVGEDTTDVLVKEYNNCIYEVKRLIGLDFTKEEYKKEIERLAFKVVKSEKNNSVNIELEKEIEIEIEIDGKKEKIKKKLFSPVEISSFIIKQMVHNAENYLGKKIKKLVITVPAYFNEDQKKMTQQAAELLGLGVIRIINEPTAAALAYGFTKEKLEDKKILVFDLGGGTFDVSILAFESEKTKDKTESKNLTVLSISGDMHLGGEDFDNALVDYVIKKQNINNEIKNNKEAMKKLKVACENIKKILSFATETTLRINNLYKDKDKNIEIDVCEKITRREFEEACQPLFDRLQIPIKTALSNKHISKGDINEVILIGGSTRIPKVKEFINLFFDNKVKINDSINADEAVAYGATLQAEKILYNRDKIISNLHILDITPFSLGIRIINNSKDKEIQKEGGEMSVIIKRGSPLPISNTEIYETVSNNQTKVGLKIYEGENKYVKYNHLLKETIIEGLTPKPKGETKISVEFKIDVNGILFVKAIETSVKDGKTIELTVRNDEISFSEEEMKKMKKKMDLMIKILKHNKLAKEDDYTNLKESLKIYKDSYDNCKEDEIENKKIYLENFNEAMEDFINDFNKNDKNFDNETFLEKFYLNIKELFLFSYIEYLKLTLDKAEKKSIFEKIKKYLDIFINKTSGYLNNLLEILLPLQKDAKTKREFNDLIIFVMEQLNNCGIECIKKNTKFCKYHSLIYFEQSLNYYQKYLSNENQALLGINLLKKMKEQKQISEDYINDINSGAAVIVKTLLLKEEIFDESSLSFIPNKTGFTEKFKILGGINKNTNQLDNENINLILREYEKVLASIQINPNLTEKEGICIASILKLNSLLALFDSQRKYLFDLADRCKLIIEHLKIDENKKWCIEFFELYEQLQKMNMDTNRGNNHELLRNIKNLYPEVFDELEKEFEKTRGNIEFIDYITTTYPYDEIEKDKKTVDFKTYNLELLLKLKKRYQPENYTPGDKNSEKNYCIKHEIASKLGNLISKLNK